MVKPSFKLKSILCVFLIGCMPFIRAQTFGHRSIGIDQGLPSSEVYSVLQDDDGYIWGATDRGLFSYNGNTTKIYTVHDGLPSHAIYKLFKDEIGRIWMASSDNRVAYIHHGKITIVPASNGWVKEIGGGRNLIINIGLDEAGDLWLSTVLGGEIQVFAKGGFRDYKIFTHPSSNIKVRKLRGSSVLPSINYTGGSWYEYLDERKMEYIAWPNNKHGFVKGLNIDAEVSYQLYAIQDARGDFLISLGNILFRLTSKGEVEKIVYPKRIIGVGMDRKGGIWVSCIDHGFYYYASGNIDSKPLLLWEGESISDMEIDYEGGLWFSSIRAGLFYVPNLYHLQFTQGELDEEIIVFGTADNQVYGSTFTNYFFKIDSLGESYGKYWESKSRQQYGIVAKAGDELIYSGHLAAIINEKLETEHVFEKWNGPFRAVDFCVKNGMYIFASHVHVIVTTKDEVLKFLDVDEDPITIECLSNEQVWVGTREGLFELTKELRLRRLFPENKGLRGHITDIQQSEDGTIAIATLYDGVFLYNGKKWMHISETEGLPSKMCNSLRFRGSSELWVGSNRGLSRIEWKDQQRAAFRITNFTKEQGLTSNEVKFVGVTEHKVWAGTRRGITCIDLDKDLINLTPPKHKLSKLMFDGEEHRYFDNMQIHSDLNNLSFYFDVFSYRNPEGNFIRYKIQDESETFTNLNGNVLSLINMSPGKYIIEVYAVNSDETVSDTPVILRFEILPPFYGTWWFRILLGCVFIFLVYLILRWRFMLQRRKDLERLKIERQLSSSQLTAIRSQMNPHFIFNAFNGIQRYVLQKDRMETYRYVSKFSTLIREVLEQSSENYISLQKEIEMLQNYVEIESLRFDNKFVFQLEIDVPEALMEYEIPAMIVQPFVENAIWHGLMPLDDRLGELVLRFSIEHRNLVIEVIDNGIGREESAKIRKKAKASSMGLRLIDERIQLVNTLQPNEPVSVWIEDLTDEHGKACGTRVSISMKLMQEE